MQEVWKFIEGFGKRYDVSNYGRVRSYIKRGSNKVVKTPQTTMIGGLHTSGYRTVLLRDGNKKYNKYVHRLVLFAFVGKCPDGMESCHKDNIKTNNKSTNLEWNTHRANIMEYGGHPVIGAGGESNHQSKLTVGDVRIIRERADNGETHTEIAKDYPVQRRNITRIINRKRWAHVK